ncbi:MAG TPA: (2Fe-2S)-binding protein [Rugosimonospora sp.]
MSPPQEPGPGLVPADPALVVAAIARAGAGNPLLGIGVEGDDPGTTGDGTTGDADGVVAEIGTGQAGRLVGDVGAWLGHPERRVAASLVVLGYAARLVGPTLAVLLRDGIVLDVRPDRVRYAYSPRRGFTLRLPEPAGWRTAPDPLASDGLAPDRLVPAWSATVVDAHLRPFIDAVRSVVPVAAGLLWGNVASGLTGALRALADDGAAPLTRCHDTGLALLDRGPLRGSGDLTVHNARLSFRRRSCCLYYRIDGAGTCGDCPLERSSAQE